MLTDLEISVYVNTDSICGNQCISTKVNLIVKMFNLESQTDICIAVYDIYALSLSYLDWDKCSIIVTETGITCVAISGTQCSLTSVNL